MCSEVSHRLVVKDDPMRTHQWMTAFLSGAILFLGSWKAEAQYPNGSGYAAYTPVSAQVPEGFNPYPTISPYDNAFSETYHENGHWLFNSNNNTQYRYYMSIEALIARPAAPNEANVGTGRNVVNPWFVEGPNALDNSDNGLIFAFGQNGIFPLVGIRGPYPSSNTGFMSAPTANGFQTKFGVDTPTGQTFEMSGFGIFPGHSYLVHGRPIVRVGRRDIPAFNTDYTIDGIYGNAHQNAQGINAGPNGLNPVEVVDVDVVNVFNPGLAVEDGSTNGTIIRADLYQKKAYQTDVYGAQASVLQMPSRKVGPFTVRPVFGVRYVNTNSVFDLEMHDSGLEYDVFPMFTADPDDRDALLPGGPESITLIPNPVTRMYLSSDVETHLGGAEMGWRYNAGGENFSIEGDTRFGLMGAQEEITVTSVGLGQPFFFNQPMEYGTIFNPLYDPTLTTFDDQKNAYVTPTFQQSINTTSRPFQYIPVLRSIPMFREANFKAGYTIFAVLQMSRPENSIVYQTGNGALPPGLGPLGPIGIPEGDPTLQPQTKVDRSLWFVQYFNLGLEWVY